MSFSRSQQTNRHLGARQTRIEEATKFNKHRAIRQNSYQITRRPSETKSSRQITRAHKIFFFCRTQKTKHFKISDKISQADQHAKALQKSSKLKTSSDSQLYGKRFKQIWTTSTISLKDERVLSSISCTL